MDSIVLEDRHDPIFIWRVHGAPDDAAIDAFVADHRRLAARGVRYLTVIDARQAAPPSREQLRRLAAAARAAGDTLAGVALVVDSQPLRRALSYMIGWRTLPAPRALCPHMAAAMLWAEARLLRAAA